MKDFSIDYFLSNEFRRDVKRLYTVGFQRQGLQFFCCWSSGLRNLNPQGGGLWKVVWCSEAQALVETM